MHRSSDCRQSKSAGCVTTEPTNLSISSCCAAEFPGRFCELGVGYRTDGEIFTVHHGLFTTKGHMAVIVDQFDERTIANMEVALARACERFPEELAHHVERKRVAAKILERATSGERTLKGFTDAAITAAAIATSKRFRNHPIV